MDFLIQAVENAQDTGGQGNTSLTPVQKKRVRSWCFTWNNYTQQDEELIQNTECRYLVYGREVGENGTPHLQGTIQFANGTSFSSVKKKLPKAHLEPCIDLLASVKYCKKDNNIFEKGEAPSDGGNKEKSRWKDALEQARTKGECEDEQIQFKHVRLIEYHHAKYMAKQPMTNQCEDKHIWIYGETGVGKSRWVVENFPVYYEKLKNKWWDGYDSHDVVVIDEFDPGDAWMSTYMKRWCDRYSFNAEIKGGMKCGIRPKLIIVTSNYSMKEIWSDPKVHEPLARRFVEFNLPRDAKELADVTVRKGET